MLRQAAEKTGDVVGDGTSTATILAQAIYADGVRNVAAGASAIDLKRGLDRGLAAAVQTLKSMAKPVESRKEKAQVAAISAHNDPAIGELVADALEKVGGDGVNRMLNGSGNLGFDAARKEFVDLLEAGIIDPAKVVRTALENAVSVASILLLTEATMTERPKKPKEHVATEPEM